MTTYTIKHVCDRCGRSLIDAFPVNMTWYPANWRVVSISGRDVDLCELCSHSLRKWFTKEGMDGIEALFDESII